MKPLRAQHDLPTGPLASRFTVAGGGPVDKSAAAAIDTMVNTHDTI